MRPGKNAFLSRMEMDMSDVSVISQMSILSCRMQTFVLAAGRNDSSRQNLMPKVMRKLFSFMELENLLSLMYDSVMGVLPLGIDSV